MIYKCKKCGFKTETQVECTCGSPMKIVLSIKTKIFIALGAVLLILILWRASFTLEFVKTNIYEDVFFLDLLEKVNICRMKSVIDDQYMIIFFEHFFNMIEDQEDLQKKRELDNERKREENMKNSQLRMNRRSSDRSSSNFINEVKRINEDKTIKNQLEK